MQTYVLICFIILLAGFTQGLSGFGSILLSLPLLAVFLDIKTVIPLVALIAYFHNHHPLCATAKAPGMEKIYPLFIGAAPGVPLGVFFLKKLDQDIIQWILGVTLIAYSLYSLFFRSSYKPMRTVWAYMFGFLSGCLAGALSAGGPPVIVYTSLQNWKKDTIKVTLQGFFVVSGPIVILFQALSGLTTTLVIRYFLVSVPFLVLGTLMGSLVYGKIPDEHYKKLILVLLAFLGAFMIYRAL